MKQFVIDHFYNFVYINQNDDLNRTLPLSVRQFGIKIYLTYNNLHRDAH